MANPKLLRTATLDRIGWPQEAEAAIATAPAPAARIDVAAKLRALW